MKSRKLICQNLVLLVFWLAAAQVYAGSATVSVSVDGSNLDGPYSAQTNFVAPLTGTAQLTYSLSADFQNDWAEAFVYSNQTFLVGEEAFNSETNDLTGTLSFQVNGGTTYYLYGEGTPWDADGDEEAGGSVSASVTYPTPDYTYTTSDGAVTITGYTGPGGAIIIPSMINGLPVTSIEGYAFQANNSITNIMIPSCVTNIGYGFSAGCGNLKAINVDSGNLDYSSLNGVLFDRSQDTLVQYPAGLLSGSYVIPNGVTSIEDSAFVECSSLTTITIPDSVTNIGNEAFFLCNLTNLTIPNSVTSIGEEAFDFCASLTSVAIGNGVTSIGSGAFAYCYSLTSITIPNSVTSIGDGAFAVCRELTSITIPNSVTKIDDDAFENCLSLTSVYFQGNAPTADSSVFTNDPKIHVYYVPGTLGWTTFASSVGITPVVWPDGVQIAVNPTNAPVGLAIQFSCPNLDSSGNAITNWNWNFGDGTASINQNPSHIYATVGTFTPIVFAVNGLGTVLPGYGPSITVTPPVAISGLVLSGANLTISGGYGISGLTCYVLATTNLALPRDQWTPVATNIWSANGNFSLIVTNAVNSLVPQQYYILQIP